MADRVSVELSSLPAVSSPLRVGDVVFGWPFRIVVERGKRKRPGEFRFLGVYEGAGKVCVYGPVTMHTRPAVTPSEWRG